MAIQTPQDGYKQTEVGIVPSDWEVKKFGDIFNISAGGDFDPSRFSFIQDEAFCYPIYSNAISEKGLYGYCSYNIYKEDSITVTARGTLGIANYRDHKFTAIGRVLVLEPKELCDGRFFSEFINNRIDFVVESTGVPQLTAPQISKYELPVPSFSEQTAIAAVLSEADALISSLEKLIAKKQTIKHGAMQELLTGNKRLPGFSGKWEVKKLGEIFIISAGGDFDPSQSSLIQDEINCYPIYSNAISKKGLYGYCSYNDHEADSITVSARGTLGIANYRDHKFTAIGRVLVLKPKVPSDGRFFSEFINNRIDFVVESTGVPQLTAPQISKYELPVPLFPEQTAIAQILNDMESEIELLEQKLAKYRMIKKGMMQELLTGRIRLV